MDINIFNIQHYSVHDGPGIRTLVFMKGCPLSCIWCCNPESQSSQVQLRHIDFKCKQCGKCISVCPHNAIHFQDEKIITDFIFCRNCIDKPCLDYCYHNARSTAGKIYSTHELLGLILKDKEFYDNSGGGVTFSGGEPFSQPNALIEMLKLCKENNISTAVETCGYANTTLFLQAAEYIDYFLFDIKIVNRELHKKYAGQYNDLIIDNLTQIARKGYNIVARIPLIPEITDGIDNIMEIISLCKELKIKQSNLEIYHTLGVDKYEEFGVDYLYKPQIERERSYYYHIRDMFIENGIECEII